MLYFPNSESARTTSANKVVENKKAASNDSAAPPSPSVQPTETPVASPNSTNTKSAELNPAFSSISTALKSQTKVPILLPEYLSDSDSSNQTFAILEKATPTQYVILLAYAETCNGSSACRLGGLSGEAGTLKIDSTEAETVTLSDNTKAYFTPAKCGANCSDATLSWSQGEYFYTVGIKAGKKDKLVKIANSAIANGAL